MSTPAPRRDEVLTLLAEHTWEMGALGVLSISVFGSVARDDARPDSDVDVLVEVADGTGYFGLAKIRLRLEKIVGRRVDLVTPGGLRPQLRDEILREAVRAA